jgi:hypothetical protein
LHLKPFPTVLNISVEIRALASQAQRSMWRRNKRKASASFLQKRSKKPLLCWTRDGFTALAQVKKSFLRAFFQKSATFFLISN